MKRKSAQTKRKKRSFRWLLLGSAVFISFSSAPACLNEYDPNVALAQSHSLLEQLTEHRTREPWAVRRDRLRKLLATTNDFRLRNDLGTALIHTGEVAEAVTIFEQIEIDKPGLYSTASNLGTAYELSGKDPLALEWIREGIERNPEAHEGTEWLHARILEAKIALVQDPHWLESHSILSGEPLKKDSLGKPATGNRGEELKLEQVKNALIYQLHERLQFVPPPDAVVGDLLFELGFLVSVEGHQVAIGKDVFKLSVRYLPDTDPSRKTALENLMAGRGKLVIESPISKQSESSFYTALIFVLVLASLLAIAVKRSLQRKIAQNR